MDGFTGFKTAAAEELPDAVAVMDPFYSEVARLSRCPRVGAAGVGFRGRNTSA